jgi:polysaccharide deacetylase family protein (PEP-CTERM system associated)
MTPPGRPDPILTVDVEDWFHVCGHAEYADVAAWPGMAARVGANVDVLLELLDGSGSRATFFVLGWIARAHPGLVRKIAAAGHEIACHGDLHRRVFEMSLEEFREDVRRSKGELERQTGAAVTAFRAPEWSMRSVSNPALAVLVEEGFRLDSSLVAAPPVGDLSNPKRPVILETASGPILEVPTLSGSFFFRRAILGGGVCSRLSRFSRVEELMAKEIESGVAPVLYLHPWELDEEHPPMRLSLVGTLVHFAGRLRTRERLAELVKRYRFVPISSVQAPAKAPVRAGGQSR